MGHGPMGLWGAFGEPLGDFGSSLGSPGGLGETLESQGCPHEEPRGTSGAPRGFPTGVYAQRGKVIPLKAGTQSLSYIVDYTVLYCIILHCPRMARIDLRRDPDRHQTNAKPMPNL